MDLNISCNRINCLETENVWNIRFLAEGVDNLEEIAAAVLPEISEHLMVQHASVDLLLEEIGLNYVMKYFGLE